MISHTELLAHLSFEDVDDILRWTDALSDDDLWEARRLALEVVVDRMQVGPPWAAARQVKALTVLLAGDLREIGMAHANAIVAGLIGVVETTFHSEIQFRCGGALANLLLRSAVDEDFFVRGVVLLRALAEVCIFSEARAYFRSILEAEAPLGQKIAVRERSVLPDDHLPLWFPRVDPTGRARPLDLRRIRKAAKSRLLTEVAP